MSVGAMPQPLLLQFGELVIDLERYRVLAGRTLLKLPYREYALLVYLAGRAGQVVHRRQLMEEGLVLEREGQRYIEEVEGIGYRFKPRPVSSNM
jgi:DNA-binding response OmpR family regulator